MKTTKNRPTARNDRASFARSNSLVACVLALGIGCSTEPGSEKGSGGQGGNGSGGSSVTSGSGSGGDSATGGSRSGGTSDSSSSVATGGTSGSGGSVASSSSSGGATTSGGRATGGSTGSGGTSASGGEGGSGGGSGGTTASGGRNDTGGTASAGGTSGSATGGVTGTGGTGGDRPDGGPDARPDGGGTTTFNPCTAGAACKIMPLGDSITEGCCSNTWGGYRIELFRQAVKGGKNITFVGNVSNGPTTPIEGKTFPRQHEGHGGWTISQISGIADSTLSKNKPDIVLLKIGTNDINGGGSAGAPNGLKNLINQITKDVPSALLVVSSIIPIKDDNTNNRVKTYNATIPATVRQAADAGKHVIFVDSYAAYVGDSSWKTKYMGDNLHPNQAGYELLGQTWYAAISAVLP